VTDLQPTTISTGTTETLTGTGTVDETVSSAHFTATVKAAGVKLTSCEGDATADITCKLPLGAGSIVVKKVSYPIAAGKVAIPVDVTTSSLIPASLAKVDVEIRAQEQNGEDVICLDVHTAKQSQEEAQLTSEGGTLAVTWEDCGAQHATVTDLQPTTISTGTTETLTGTGTVDETVSSAHFTATVKAAGVKLTSCEGDATADITCKLPLGAGSIVVKKVSYPIAAGKVAIPVDVTTSSLIPASLAKVDVEIRAQEQNGEDVICLNVHTAKQAEEEAQLTLEGGTLAVTWEDCGDDDTRAAISDVQPTQVQIGATTVVTGTALLVEDITEPFLQTASIKASGVHIKTCGPDDASAGIDCELPLGLGSAHVRPMTFPLAAGEFNIVVDTKISSLVPAKLANTDTQVTGVTASGTKVFCVNIHAQKQEADVSV